MSIPASALRFATKRYTSRLRLDRAASELVSTQRPILEIAHDCSFASHAVFTRAFLRRFGMSPQSYRARVRYPLAR